MADIGGSRFRPRGHHPPETTLSEARRALKDMVFQEFRVETGVEVLQMASFPAEKKQKQHFEEVSTLRTGSPCPWDHENQWENVYLAIQASNIEGNVEGRD